MLFTVLPAGFINIFSVNMIAASVVPMLAGLAAVTLVYVLLALLLFNAGIKRYKVAG